MSVLTKKLLRTLWQNRGQALAVAAVVLCGTACYITLTSLHRNLLLTRDTYYAQNRFADFEIQLERAPQHALFKLETISGVRSVRGRVVMDVNLDFEGAQEARAGRVVSMPDKREPVLNDIVLRAGRYFEPGVQNEVILSERFALANHLEVGDSVTFTAEGKRHRLRIVGLALSPEYIYVIRNISELVPSPERFGILWTPETFAQSAFGLEGAYNNIIGDADANVEIDPILEQADDLLETYGVFAKFDSEDQLSNRFISDEIKGLGVTAKVLPSIFLGIAALVLMVLLNRMVRNERTQIGLLKAYGYSNFAVAAHYLQYALILTSLGCIGGFFVGQWLAQQMIGIYVQFYQFPILRSRVYPDVLARSMGIAAGFALFGAVIAARRAAQIHPAESMRPESPRRGRRIWLERFPAIWSRLGFTWKIIVRNLGRNRFRAALNAFGVMISAGLLIVGFFSLDGINYILDFQYDWTQKQDVKVRLSLERGKGAVYEAASFKDVREAEPMLEYPFEVRNGWREKDVLVIGLPRGADLHHLLIGKDEEVRLPERGLVLSERLANDLSAKVGDTLTVKPLFGKITEAKDVRVAKTVKQYFGASAYMDLEAMSRLLDEPYAVNALLLRTDVGTARDINERLKDVPAVAGVEIKQESLQSLLDTLAQSMWIMSATSIVFAGVIALSIIYNVTTVSLAERERELASLRVLGFTKEEVGRVLYNENLITGGIGLALGIPFGLLLCLGLVRAYDTELFRFPFYVSTRTYIVAVVMTLLFLFLANVAVQWKVRRLNLVDTLKARE